MPKNHWNDKDQHDLFWFSDGNGIVRESKRKSFRHLFDNIIYHGLSKILITNLRMKMSKRTTGIEDEDVKICKIDWSLTRRRETSHSRNGNKVKKKKHKTSIIWVYIVCHIQLGFTHNGAKKALHADRYTHMQCIIFMLHSHQFDVNKYSRACDVITNSIDPHTHNSHTPLTENRSIRTQRRKLVEWRYSYQQIEAKETSKRKRTKKKKRTWKMLWYDLTFLISFLGYAIVVALIAIVRFIFFSYSSAQAHRFSLWKAQRIVFYIFSLYLVDTFVSLSLVRGLIHILSMLFVSFVVVAAAVAALLPSCRYRRCRFSCCSSVRCHTELHENSSDSVSTYKYSSIQSASNHRRDKSRFDRLSHLSSIYINFFFVSVTNFSSYLGIACVCEIFNKKKIEFRCCFFFVAFDSFYPIFLNATNNEGKENNSKNNDEARKRKLIFKCAQMCFTISTNPIFIVCLLPN